jgi:hypothetical protein
MSTRARAGFTIIEGVLAMGILMMGLSVILTLFTFGAGMSRNAQLRADSAAAVEAVVADLEEGLFPLGPDGEVLEPLTLRGRPVPGYDDLTYDAVAVPDPTRLGDLALAAEPGVTFELGPILYRVDVRMTWRSQGESKARGFSVLIPREVPFGTRLRKLVSG